MNRETVERLNRLNRAFYESHAEDFSRTRESAWPGWDRVLEALPSPPAGGLLSILDAGCGNGRFGRYLEDRLPAGFDYTGIDASAGLLEHAAALLTGNDGGRRLLVEIDLLREAPSSRLEEAAYDLVVAFGLTHHLPGLERRRALLNDLGRMLRPGGILTVAFWQFADTERFQRRMVAWEDFNATVTEPVDTSQLERGDHLLTWGRRSTTVRYCHHSDAAEIDDLFAGAGLEPVATYRSDAAIDRFNLYTLLRRAR